MFNVGGGELLVIMLIALIVLGPQRLPDAARQVGKAMADLRRLSTGFQNEVRSALDTADDPNRVAARRNVLAKEASRAAGASPTRSRPSRIRVRTEPLVAGPPIEPQERAATAARSTSRRRGGGQEVRDARRPAAKKAAAQKAAPPRRHDGQRRTVQKATTDSAAEPADEASTPPTKT